MTRKVFNTETMLHHFLTTLKVFNIEKGLHHFLETFKSLILKNDSITFLDSKSFLKYLFQRMLVKSRF